MTVGRRGAKHMENAAFAQAQRAEVADRDGGVCAFERAMTLTPGSTHGPKGERITGWTGNLAWVRCRAPAVHTAHLARRWVCGMIETDDGIPLKYHPIVAIAGCYDCHTRYDSRQDDRVRAPELAMAKAEALINHTLAAAEARGEAVVWPWPKPA